MYYATQDGSKISESYVDKRLIKIENLFDLATLEIDKLDVDVSLLSILDASFDELMKSLKLNSTEKSILKAIYNGRLNEEKSDTACGDLNNLSAIGWNAFVNSPGDKYINLKYGYASVIEYLKSKVTNNRIVLNEVVTQLLYPNGTSMDTVKVVTKNAQNGLLSVHEADHVIVTVPLGYLKSNYKTLFGSYLPLDKANAIQRLGYGTVNKIWLVFDKPFQTDFGGIEVLWRNDLNLKLNSIEKCGAGVC